MHRLWKRFLSDGKFGLQNQMSLKQKFNRRDNVPEEPDSSLDGE